MDAYGTLILPHPDGTGSIEIEALLMKESETAVDSIFLGGAPAPEQFVTAFGLIQGATITTTVYTFIAAGLPSSALSLEAVNDVVVSARMSDGIRNLVSSNHSINKELLSIKTSPNPSDGNFSIAFDKTDGATWTFNLYNLLGQQIAIATNDAIEMSYLPTGLYYLQINTNLGTITKTVIRK